jgi:hypothetical protein
MKNSCEKLQESLTKAKQSASEDAKYLREKLREERDRNEKLSAELEDAREKIKRLESNTQITVTKTLAQDSMMPLDGWTTELSSAGEDSSGSIDHALACALDTSQSSNPLLSPQVQTLYQELRGTDLDEEANIENHVEDMLLTTTVSKKRGRTDEQVSPELTEQLQNPKDAIPRRVMVPRACLSDQQQCKATAVERKTVKFPSGTGVKERFAAPKEAYSNKRQKTDKSIIQRTKETPERDAAISRPVRFPQTTLRPRRKRVKTPASIQEWAFVPSEYKSRLAGISSHPTNAVTTPEKGNTNF